MPHRQVVPICTINHMNHEQNTPTFHFTGWLIGILIMVDYNRYITGKYNPLYIIYPKQPGFFLCSYVTHHTHSLKWPCARHLGAEMLLPSPANSQPKKTKNNSIQGFLKLAHRPLVVAHMCDFPLVHLPTGGVGWPPLHLNIEHKASRT